MCEKDLEQSLTPSSSIIDHCILSYIKLYNQSVNSRSEKKLPLLSKALSELSNDSESSESSPRATTSQEPSTNTATPNDNSCSPLSFGLAGYRSNFYTISPFKQREAVLKKAGSLRMILGREKAKQKLNFSPSMKHNLIFSK
eukprot:TRINITY_DN3810_c0_g6_i1.p1 TRINITY_DN3810_c0_g6~~TRINITY_DN3810_c0_g6_i1.p1  ORF type:complete len:142 (-),score=24.63 TRINITY_DN3810_c0_g6_i1:76-501(-)